jgi:hypothetical protein
MSPKLQYLLLKVLADSSQNIQCLRVFHCSLEQCIYGARKEAACPEVGFALFVFSGFGTMLRHSVWV